MAEPTPAARTRAFAMMVGDWRKAAIAAGFTLQRVVVVEGVDPSAAKPTLCIRPAAAAIAASAPPALSPAAPASGTVAVAPVSAAGTAAAGAGGCAP